MAKDRIRVRLRGFDIELIDKSAKSIVQTVILRTKFSGINFLKKKVLSPNEYLHPTPSKAVENAVVLEEVAKMAFGAIMINTKQKIINRVLLKKHYLRKHGKNAYYGQYQKGDE